MEERLITDILLLTTIVVYIVDVSGFTTSWKKWLKMWLGIEVGSCKPFDCSLCLSWWCGIIYLLVTHHFTLGGIALVAVASVLSKPIGELFSLGRYIIEFTIYKFNKLIDKLWN